MPHTDLQNLMHSRAPRESFHRTKERLPRNVITNPAGLSQSGLNYYNNKSVMAFSSLPKPLFSILGLYAGSRVFSVEHLLVLSAGHRILQHLPIDLLPAAQQQITVQGQPFPRDLSIPMSPCLSRPREPGHRPGHQPFRCPRGGWASAGSINADKFALP